MSGRQYLDGVRHGAVLVILVAAVGALFGYGLSSAVNARYRATAQLYVGVAARIELIPTQFDRFAEVQAQSLAAAVNSPTVLGRASRRLGIPAEDLAGKVSAVVPIGKQLIDISVTDADAARSAQLANAVSSAFISSVGAPGPGQKLVIVHRAWTPDQPVRPNVVGFVGGGGLLGLLVGLMVVPAAAVRRGNRPGVSR